MKAMPRAKPVLSQSPRSIAVRFVVGDSEERERTGGYAHAHISSNPTDSRGIIAIADIREHRIRVGDRGFWLQSCGGADKAVIQSGSV
jgi:hypothetical protein